MQTKKTVVCFLLIFIFLFLTIFSVYGNENYKLKEHVKFYFFWSNLSGLGFGSNYFFNDTFSIHFLAGADPLVPLIWSAPYSGNMINFSFKTEVNLFSGFYAAPGWYLGMFHLEIDNLDFSEYIWQSGPTIALGYKFPNNVKQRRIGIEFGAVFNLPERITSSYQSKLDSWIIESKRSQPSEGALFPFLSLIVEL
ncbi:hypothetical protein H8E88_03305 [candidate division KSB1 bacterium]|nr:hypothetical protein [candidate division KSB1 bacterium]